MGIIDQIKRFIATKRPATRAEAESTDGKATEAADRLWHEHQHETAPVGHSDTEPTDQKSAKPKESQSAK